MYEAIFLTPTQEAADAINAAYPGSQRPEDRSVRAYSVFTKMCGVRAKRIIVLPLAEPIPEKHQAQFEELMGLAQTRIAFNGEFIRL